MVPFYPAHVAPQVATSHFVLRGASQVEKLFIVAKTLGLPAIAVTGHDLLVGAARANTRWKGGGSGLAHTALHFHCDPPKPYTVDTRIGDQDVLG